MCNFVNTAELSKILLLFCFSSISLIILNNKSIQSNAPFFYSETLETITTAASISVRSVWFASQTQTVIGDCASATSFATTTTKHPTIKSVNIHIMVSCQSMRGLHVVVMSEREEWDEIPEDQYTRAHRRHYVGIKRNEHIEQQKKKKNNQLKGVGREKKNHINYLCELALLCCYFFNIFSVIIDIFIIYTRVRLNPMNSLLDV